MIGWILGGDWRGRDRTEEEKRKNRREEMKRRV